jgi:hypothetical protein
LEEWTVELRIDEHANPEYLYECEPAIHYHLACLRPITVFVRDALVAHFRAAGSSW